MGGDDGDGDGGDILDRSDIKYVGRCFETFRMPAHNVLPVAPCRYYNETVRCPGRTEAYLKHAYGNDVLAAARTHDDAYTDMEARGVRERRAGGALRAAALLLLVLFVAAKCRGGGPRAVDEAVCCRRKQHKAGV